MKIDFKDERSPDYEVVKEESAYIKKLEKNANIISAQPYFIKGNLPMTSAPTSIITPKNTPLKIYAIITPIPLYSKGEKIEKEYEQDLEKATQEIENSALKKKMP